MKKRLLWLGLAAGWIAWKKSQPQIPATLKNKTVIITGASAGIGKVTAHAFSAHGAKVVLVARRVELLEQVKAELAPYGNPVLVIAADATKEEEMQRIVTATLREFGRIDVLVNNAGLTIGGWFEQNDPAEIGKMLDLNLYALIRLTQLTLPHMIRQGYGHIVNVSSIAAVLGSPGQAAYGASKAGVNSFSNSIRREYRSQGVRVSVVMPGWTRTEMTAHMDEQKMRDALLLGYGVVMENADIVADAIVEAVRFNRPFTALGGPLFKFSALAFIGHSHWLDWFFHRVYNSQKMTDTMSELGV